MAAQLDIEQVDPYEAVMLACDLIAEGAPGAATLDLAIQSPSTLHVNHAETLLRQMLLEWHVEVPSHSRSAEIVALDLCRQVLAGTPTPELVGHRLLGALGQTDDVARIDRLLRLLDRLEYDLGGHADQVLRTDLVALADDIVNSGIRQ